jgi:hypothetical protein
MVPFGFNKGSSGRGIPIRPSYRLHMGPWLGMGSLGLSFMISACMAGLLGNLGVSSDSR